MEKNKQKDRKAEVTEFDLSESVGDSALDQEKDLKKTKSVDEEESVGSSAMKPKKKSK